ncbi:unnamed protein product [Ceutorhynchus assimilis]|uniref:Protein CUSTOS n=1 Tax=Ceutorhynchus assimilis TaxID=467358 RepID=A0A9N9QH14_9CUCU|nr:unnamed protein product [Ceutorhynchus assimilis]
MSSASSDDENLDNLKEAVDPQFFNDSLYKKKGNLDHHLTEPTGTSKTNARPSLRKQQDDDEQFNLFRVTPEFQNYVAKHLSKTLEEELQKVLKSVKDTCLKKKARKSGGIKLLSNSEKFLRIDKSSSVNNRSLESAQLVRKKILKKVEDIDEAELKRVVVEPADILSKKDTKCWSTRSKAPIFNYKKNSEGSLVLIEPSFK